MEFPIGTRLKDLRKSKGMSIAELSEKSNVSTGLISQIERNLVVPSVVNLYRIAQALDTDINYFFENGRSREAKITRRGDHKRMITDQGHGIYELFTSSRDGLLASKCQPCFWENVNEKLRFTAIHTYEP